jgi:HSP20 family molecular chaperone IbpA
MRSKANKTDPFWRKLENLFEGDFPFPKMPDIEKAMKDPAWAEQFVEEAMHPFQSTAASHSKNTSKASTPSTVSTTDNHPTQPTKKITETKTSIIVRVQLPPEANPYALRVYVAAVTVRIEGLPQEKKMRITLPKEVQVIGIRSTFKDGVLVVRIPKKKGTSKGRQISVTIQ